MVRWSSYTPLGRPNRTRRSRRDWIAVREPNSSGHRSALTIQGRVMRNIVNAGKPYPGGRPHRVSRTLIADDHPVGRISLRQVLTRQPDIAVLGEVRATEVCLLVGQ